jgi:hypothetical protein
MPVHWSTKPAMMGVVALTRAAPKATIDSSNALDKEQSKQLKGKLEQLNRLRALARQGPITLVYSAHDEVHNDAVALRGFLLGRHTNDATSLSAADDRIRQSDWLPPQEGVIPRIRLGGRSINVLWAIPLVVVFLILGIALAQQLRTMPGVQDFIARYPGVEPRPRRRCTRAFPCGCGCCISSISS